MLRFAELADSMWIFGPNLEVTRFLVRDLPIWKSGVQCISEIKRRHLDSETVFLSLDAHIGIGRKSIKSMMGGRRLPRAGTDKPVKFIKKQHLEDFINKGIVQFSPATRFQDKSLTIAQQDNEIEYSSYINPAGVTISTLDEPEKKIPIIDSTNLKISRKIGTNYYLFSTTYGPDPRHFLDFNAEACVFIENPVQFIRRIRAAIEAQSLEWECIPWFFKVGYFDKYEASKYAMASMAKDIKYWYQFETRLILLPPIGKPSKELEPLLLSIGSLVDITSTFQTI